MTTATTRVKKTPSPFRFVAGAVGRLCAARLSPRFAPLRKDLFCFGWDGPRHDFRADAEGFLSEEPQYGTPVFARELPEDVLPALAILDAEIAKVEAKRKRIEKKRQALLLDAAKRGTRVKAPKDSRSSPREWTENAFARPAGATPRPDRPSPGATAAEGASTCPEPAGTR